MADIKEGTFIGTATVTQPDSTLRSLEVVVFPENLRGFGEGHYPWDLGSKSMMTNATVANAVRGVDGQTVTVTYKGGEKKIDVPANVPVVAVVPATKADIMPGAPVFVPTERQADGSLRSGAVLFGKDGVIRYTLVARSASGALNVSYEGIRCASRERRLYAFGREDKTWAPARSSDWTRISFSPHHAALADEYFCPVRGAVRTADEAVSALKRGGHAGARSLYNLPR